MPFHRQELATAIADRLNLLANQLKTRTRASLTDANHSLEYVMVPFFNALFGWDLINLNSEEANFPAIDLADRPRRIAMQITNEEASDKISGTTTKAIDHGHGASFDRLIIFFLLPRKPGLPKHFNQPPDGPAIETWDLADLLKQMQAMEIEPLKAALLVLDEEMSSGPTEPQNGQLKDGWYRLNPLRAPRFFGREAELTELASLWDEYRVLAITGTGGLGKTALAVEFLARFGPDSWDKVANQRPFPRRLLTHDYYSQPGHDSALAALLDQAGTDPKGLDRAEMESHLSAAFAQPDTFLYLEGCEKAESLRDLLRLTGSTARVLLTTRDAVAPYGAHGWPLPPLQIPDAAALITHLSGRGDPFAPPAAVTGIATLLAGHGLACRLAGQLLSHQSRSAAGLLADLQQKGLGLLSQEKREHESVTWLLSQTALGLEEKLPGCARVWHVLALGALSPLPLSLLRACLVGVDAEWLRERLEALQHEGIVQLSADFPPESGDEGECAAVLAHALIQTHGLGDLLRDLPPDPAADAEALYFVWREGWSSFLVRCFHAKQVPGGHRRYQALVTPLEGLIARLGEREPADSRPFSRLLDLAAHTHRQAGRYLAAEAPCRRALEVRERTFGPEHPLSLQSLNNLASLLAVQGDLEGAEHLIRRALEARERNQGPEDPATLSCLNNLGNILKDQGDSAGAELLYRRALEARERTLGPEHSDTLTSLNNLANLLFDQSNLEEAELLYRRALETRERQLGLEHTDTLTSVNNLGVLLTKRGDLEEAEPLYLRALEARERSLGPEHPDTLTCLNNLGVLHEARDEWAEAVAFYRRAVDGAQLLLVPEHPHRQMYERNLAQAERMLSGGTAEEA
jgi:tetratricopeptide (TPR) repeat protein